MSLSASLNIKQSQSIVMTPQLMQSIRLLQFNPYELSQFIESQVQSNPLLELTRSASDAAPDADLKPQEADSSDPEQDFAVTNHGEMTQIAHMEDAIDVNLRNVYPDDEAMKVRTTGQNLDAFRINASGEIVASGSDIDFDSFAAQKPGIREVISGQIGETIKCASERMIAAELADHLDDAGYIAFNPDALSERLGVNPEQIEAVLKKVQQFDPPGIFARNLSECLELQLERKNRLDPAMKVMLQNLELLARRDFNSLKKLCQVEESDLFDMMSEVQTLDPKPGTQFEVAATHAVIPDVIVSEDNDGSWRVEMNPETLPKVLVNQSYYANVTRNIEKSSPDYNFMNECLQSAHWLSRSLDQRVQTIIKVASEIVKQQNEFLTKGVSHLKPLNLKTIAEAISMHESTVSRVTSNKYMLTPRGLFELKYFFTVSISGGEGADAHSAESIRHKIKDLINAETIENVLSDDDMVKILKEQDIEIARRTVAKYREAMNIASSVQRRREKKLLAQNAKLKASA